MSSAGGGAALARTRPWRRSAVRSGGLGPALRTLARRATIAVELDVAAITRLPEPVEVAAYYVVSEALTNATRHAHASVVEVDAEASGGTLRVRVRDDGVGGVDPVRGSGLVAVSRRWVARSPCRARWAAARRCPASFRS